MIVLHKIFNKLAVVVIAIALLLPIILAPALASPSEPFVLKDNNGQQKFYSKLQDVVLYINAHPGKYTLYLTKDYDMSQDGDSEYLRGNLGPIDLTICSSGGQHTLTNGYDYHFSFLENVKLTFKDIILDGNDKRGGIKSYNSDVTKCYITLDKGFVLKNCNSYDTTIFLSNTDLTIYDGVTITGNKNKAISADYLSHVTIKGGTFTNNKQVLNFSGEMLDIDGGLFENNFAESHYGSPIYIYSDNPGNVKCKVSIKNAKFIGNSAEVLGGAIGIFLSTKNNNTVELKNCTFKNNNAIVSGGAIYVGQPFLHPKYGYAPINIVNCQFIDNYSYSGGGAIYDDKYANKNGNYDFTYPAEPKISDYDNLIIDANTVFSGNKAYPAYSMPPKNYKDFTNLKFKSNSFTGKFHPLMPLERSLLNNYDVNYYYPGFAYVFDANGGSISTDNGSVKALVERLEPDAKYTIGENPPVKGSIEFLGWEDEEGKLHQPGEELPPADRNRVFIAKWNDPISDEKIISAPPTGDTFNIVLYVVLAVIAGIGIGTIMRIKNNNRKK